MNTINKLFSTLVDEAATEAEKRVLNQLENYVVPDKVFSVKEAAEYLGISNKLIYQLCAEKALPHIQAGSTNSTKPRILFRQSTLERWMREREIESTRRKA